MQPVDFFRTRIVAMINLNDSLAVLATQLPWRQIEAAIASKFERQQRSGEVLQGQDLFVPPKPYWAQVAAMLGAPNCPYA